LKVNHSIRVDGVVKGKLNSDGEMVVGASGVIEADVEVESAISGGRGVGNLIAREKIELEENAYLIGDIKTKDLVINEGAVFQGNCTMDNGKSG